MGKLIKLAIHLSLVFFNSSCESQMNEEINYIPIPEGDSLKVHPDIPDKEFYITILRTKKLTDSVLVKYEGQRIPYSDPDIPHYRLSNGAYLSIRDWMSEYAIVAGSIENLKIKTGFMKIGTSRRSDGTYLVKYSYDHLEALALLDKLNPKKMDASPDSKQIRYETKDGRQILMYSYIHGITKQVIYSCDVFANLKEAMEAGKYPFSTEEDDESYNPPVRPAKWFASGGSCLGVEMLSEDHLAEIDEGFWARSEAELPAYWSWEVRSMPGGEIILSLPKGELIRFKNEADYLLAWEGYKEVPTGKTMKTSSPIFEGMIKDEKTFHANKAEYIMQLCSLTGIVKDSLDYSLKSIEILDARIREYVLHKTYIDDLTLPLLAYTGEVIIRSQGGAWEMRNLGSDPVTLIPQIRLPNGKAFEFSIGVYDELNNKEETNYFSLSSMVGGMSAGLKMK